MRRSGSMVRRAWVTALVAGLACPAAAWAQAPGAGDKVAAEALFEEGRRLVAAGNYAEACPKFASSQRLDPSPGTLLNLASCYEKLGRSATAWATYREAASAANAAGRTEYVATAQRHADALSPKLAHLTLLVPQPVEGLQITRDGVRIDRGEWGLALPIDAGSHAVEASAAGHKSWSQTVEVAQDGVQASVTVPALEALPAEATPPVAPPPPGPAPVVPATPPGGEQPQSTGAGQRLAGWLVAGAGVIGLGVGTAFAVVAKNKYNDSLPSCRTDDPNLCNSAGVSTRNDARDAGNIASVAVGVGAAALVGGVVIWLTAPHAASPSSGTARVGVSPTPGGLVLQGAW